MVKFLNAVILLMLLLVALSIKPDRLFKAA